MICKTQQYANPKGPSLDHHRRNNNPLTPTQTRYPRTVLATKNALKLLNSEPPFLLAIQSLQPVLLLPLPTSSLLPTPLRARILFPFRHPLKPKPRLLPTCHLNNHAPPHPPSHPLIPFLPSNNFFSPIILGSTTP
nr:hypothetical protein B5O22.220 [imported] - Neurospora crassa [Neurospora crassa]